MRIFLKNESDTSIIIQLDNISITLIPCSGKYADIDNATLKLAVYPDEKCHTDPVTGMLGLSYFHRFVTVSAYDVTVTDDCTIKFYKEAAHGNNFESYTRIYPHSSDCSFSEPHYTVRDEMQIKEKIARSDKNEAIILQGASVAGKLIKAKNTFDDIVTAAILGTVALVAFILIWIFKDFKTAAAIYAGVAVSVFLLWKLILEKLLKKVKSKVKTKAEQKAEKIFLPCENMPDGIFKGKDSYFAHDYIAAVFEHSKKRI